MGVDKHGHVVISHVDGKTGQSGYVDTFVASIFSYLEFHLKWFKSGERVMKNAQKQIILTTF